MLFNSHVFLFAFLPIVWLGFVGLGRGVGERAALAWLFAGSLFFYGWWDPRYVPLLLGSIAFNYVTGLLLAAEGISALRRRSLLFAGVVVNLGLLGFYKYAGFLAENLDRAFSLELSVGAIVLPLAISFFTFQQIAYLADVHRDRRCERDPLRYGVFVAFFPQLIAGPIVHHREMLPQFEGHPARRLGFPDVQLGVVLFVIGLFKKVILADGVAGFSTPTFTRAAQGFDVDFFDAWGAALAFTLQLYFDFSGYSDMAIGLGRMFGVRLPLNFESPYRAASIIDFWRRWHITLSRFLRDYLYIPLGGNRHGSVRRYLNVFVTMLLGGLWHGAGWTFVVWGGLHGLYLLANHAFRALRTGAVGASRIGRGLGGAVTFASVVVGWVFFRAADLEAAGRMLTSMAGLGGGRLPHSLEPWLGRVIASPAWRFEGGVDWGQALALSVLLGVVFFAPNGREILGRYPTALVPDGRFESRPVAAWLRYRPSAPWAVAMAIVTVWAVLGIDRYSEFLYFQF